MKSLKTKITDTDMFGSPIQLNYKKKGNTQKTPIGGVVSIFIYLLVIIIFVRNLKQMITKENSTFFTSYSKTDFDEIGTKNLKETGLTIMYALHSVDRNQKPLSKMDLSEI